MAGWCLIFPNLAPAFLSLILRDCVMVRCQLSGKNDVPSWINKHIPHTSQTIYGNFTDPLKSHHLEKLVESQIRQLLFLEGREFYVLCLKRLYIYRPIALEIQREACAVVTGSAVWGHWVKANVYPPISVPNTLFTCSRLCLLSLRENEEWKDFF